MPHIRTLSRIATHEPVFPCTLAAAPLKRKREGTALSGICRMSTPPSLRINCSELNLPLSTSRSPSLFDSRNYIPLLSDRGIPVLSRFALEISLAINTIPSSFTCSGMTMNPYLASCLDRVGFVYSLERICNILQLSETVRVCFSVSRLAPGLAEIVSAACTRQAIRLCGSTSP